MLSQLGGGRVCSNRSYPLLGSPGAAPFLWFVCLGDDLFFWLPTSFQAVCMHIAENIDPSAV